jgi:EmrB/QacA subfamily drug resistance transporter
VRDEAEARRWKVLWDTSLAVFMVFLDVTVVNVAFPSIEQTFGKTSRAGLSWVLSAYNITFAALLLTAGRLADLYGHRRAFFAGLGVFTGASVLCAVAPTAASLTAARALQAVGGALLAPSSLALLLAEFPVERRSMAIGVWGATGAIAAVVGPSVGSALIGAGGWRLTFLVNLPVGLAAWLFGRHVLRESERIETKATPDFIGVVMGAVAIGLLALGIVQGNAWGWSSPGIVASFVGSVVLLSWFVARARRHPAPALELSLFHGRPFTVAVVSTFLFSISFYAMLLTQVLFLMGVWRYSVFQAGLGITPVPLSAGVVSAGGGWLADRYGHRKIIVIGAVLFAVGCIGLTMVGVEPSYARAWLGPALLLGIGTGLALPALISATVGLLPPTRFAQGSAVSTTVRQIAAALGVATLIAIVGERGVSQSTDAFRWAWGMIMAFALLAGAVMAALYRVPSTLSEELREPAGTGR